METLVLLLRRLRWRGYALVLAVIGLNAGCAALDEQQRRWIFQPAPLAGEPGWRTDGLAEVWIPYTSATSGQAVRLHALWSPHPNPDAPVLLYLHGARRNLFGNTFRMRNLQALGFSVLGVDYRGFGRSTDALPSEASVAEDAHAAWDWLAQHHPAPDRYIYGHSLGGAIAVQLAGEVRDAKGLIVEGTFTSIADVFRSFKWGWLPITPLITQRFDSQARIAKVTTPLLVVHGAADALIPPALGRTLYDSAPGPKRFVLVEGGTHHSTSGVGLGAYREAVRELFGLAAE